MLFVAVANYLFDLVVELVLGLCLMVALLTDLVACFDVACWALFCGLVSNGFVFVFAWLVLFTDLGLV